MNVAESFEALGRELLLGANPERARLERKARGGNALGGVQNVPARRALGRGLQNKAKAAVRLAALEIPKPVGAGKHYALEGAERGHRVGCLTLLYAVGYV